MRRYGMLTLVTGLAVLGLWRGLAGKSKAAASSPAAVADASVRPGMTQAEWRYFNSQASHWRQAMLRH